MSPQRVINKLILAGQILRLPPRVSWFQWRARRLARATSDGFSLTSSTRPRDLARLLKVAAGRRRIVELGTASGWTAIAFALADSSRTVITFDPHDRPERRRYLELIPQGVRQRITFVAQPGRTGPPSSQPLDLLYIDSSHDRDETVAEVRAWEGRLRGGALIVFDDYGHPDYPGVAEAITALGLTGQRLGTLYVHEVAPGATGAPGPPTG